ncbi:hypothetical protein ACO0LO_04185 [Undibacterium sp. TJN25]|uniref:hypothetical protein n=1 Tax=Undibacterium sp. TJN25 TaxID=3413056 RepID=UPI003BF0E0DD
MNNSLTIDELDALQQISKLPKQGRASACVSRNAKRLAGLKFVAYERDGSLSITDKGKETLFIKHCIDGLRAISKDPLAHLSGDVANFLGKKGHITPRAEGGFDITTRGSESLADIETR